MTLTAIDIMENATAKLSFLAGILAEREDDQLRHIDGLGMILYDITNDIEYAKKFAKQGIKKHHKLEMLCGRMILDRAVIIGD